jgi:site-specific recombinase XerD
VLRLYTRGRAGDDWLFPAMRNTPRPLTVRSLERLFSFYARRAGLEGSPRLYTLRHTAARRLYAVTRDLRLVQRLLGHANSHTTEIYTHVDLEACYGLFDRLGTVL